MWLIGLEFTSCCTFPLRRIIKMDLHIYFLWYFCLFHSPRLAYLAVVWSFLQSPKGFQTFDCYIVWSCCFPTIYLTHCSSDSIFLNRRTIHRFFNNDYLSAIFELVPVNSIHLYKIAVRSVNIFPNIKSSSIKSKQYRYQILRSKTRRQIVEKMDWRCGKHWRGTTFWSSELLSYLTKDDCISLRRLTPLGLKKYKSNKLYLSILWSNASTLWTRLFFLSVNSLISSCLSMLCFIPLLSSISVHLSFNHFS